MSESENKLAFATKLFQSVKRFSFLMKLRLLFYFFDSVILFFLRRPKPQSADKKRICILLLPGMGDCIIFCRLAESLKKALPPDQYELTILANDTHQKLLSNFFDRVIGLPFYKMSFNPFARIRILSQLKKLSFDELWDVNGCGECTPNIFISNAIDAGAKKVAYPGLLDCGKRKMICPEWMKKRIYSEIVTLPEDIHLLTMFQMFLQRIIGKEILPGYLIFPMKQPDDIPEKYIVFVPSGSHSRNKWGAEKFSELGCLLYEKMKLSIILCGAAADRAECTAISKTLKNSDIPVFNYAGKTGFEELVWLLSHAEHIYTIDTGSFHLSVALGAKTTVIAADAVFSTCANYPRAFADHLTIHHGKMDCMDCGHTCFEQNHECYPCVRKIETPDVEKGRI